MENRFHTPADGFSPVRPMEAPQAYYPPVPPPPPPWGQQGAHGGQQFPPYAHEMAMGQQQVPSHQQEQSKDEKGKFDATSLFSMPEKIRNSLQEKFPKFIDLSDILLVILLLYLFLDSDDDDMLIILGVLAFTWLWPLLKKEKE